MYAKAQRTIHDFRELGLNVAVDSTGRKTDKQIKAADKQGITFVLFIGDEELKSGQFKLKNLHTGKEETHGKDRIVTMVRDYRRK